MKTLDQARLNLPAKPARSTKQAVRGTLKSEMPDDDDDDNSEAVSKSSTATAAKVSSKAVKPTGAAASAAGKKVLYLCMCVHVSCHLLQGSSRCTSCTLTMRFSGQP